MSSFAFNWKFPLEGRTLSPPRPLRRSDPRSQSLHCSKKEAKSALSRFQFQLDKREAAFCQDLRRGECVIYIYIERERNERQFQGITWLQSYQCPRGGVCSREGGGKRKMDFLIAKGENGRSQWIGQFVRLSNCAQIAVSLFSSGGQTDRQTENSTYVVNGSENGRFPRDQFASSH